LLGDFLPHGDINFSAETLLFVLSIFVMEIIKPHLVSPNNYINGWKIINEHITTLEMPKLVANKIWIYNVTKQNMERFMQNMNYNETSHRIDYLQSITNDFKNVVGIAKTAMEYQPNAQNNMASLFYTPMDITFNCSKYKTTHKTAIVHHAVGCNIGEHMHTDLKPVLGIVLLNEGTGKTTTQFDYTFYPHILTKIANMLIIRGIPSFIMQLPTLIPDINPFLTVITYRLKIPNRNISNNPNKIFDYDEIPKNDVAKIEKINQRLHELYTEETRKYKISQQLSYKEFCQKYLTRNMHKIYITIIGGIITNVLFCINSNILRLDFYTLNGIAINEWINYVANDDEIIVNDVMRNRELLLQENDVKIIGKQYLYFFNRLVKNISGTGYAITVC